MEIKTEIQALKESVDKETREKKTSKKISLVKLLKTTTVRRGLIAGVGLQGFQQFVGINSVMYFSPTIVQLAVFASNQTALLLLLVAGFASNQTDLLLSLVMAAFDSIVSICFIDRTGRKKLLVTSLCGVISSLRLLSAVFHEITRPLFLPGLTFS